MAFERIAEQRIREAMEAGDFDNLPNAGSRIDLEGYFSLPAHLRMAWSVLKSADCLPAEVLLLFFNRGTSSPGPLTRSLARRFAGTLRSRGSLAVLARTNLLQSPLRARSSAG